MLSRYADFVPGTVLGHAALVLDLSCPGVLSPSAFPGGMGHWDPHTDASPDLRFAVVDENRCTVLVRRERTRILLPVGKACLVLAME